LGLFGRAPALVKKVLTMAYLMKQVFLISASLVKKRLEK
jgi:hypothetical protein